MFRINATPIITQVVNLLLAGDIPVLVNKRDNMDRYGLTVERHSRVTTPSTGATVTTFPDVTGSIVSSIFDLYIFPDFLSYPISAIHIGYFTWFTISVSS